MQIYADVIGQPMLIAGSPQTPALGAAVSAAVTAGAAGGRLRRLDRGAGPDDDAQGEALRAATRRRTRVYDELYAHLSRAARRASAASPERARRISASLMKRLLAIRERASAARA